MRHNPIFSDKHAPSLYVQNEKEDLSTKAALALTQARDKFVIRITGGCGNMEGGDGEGMMDMFSKAFDTFYGGALLFGGTQMRYIEESDRIFPGITEVGPIIRKQCPDARVLGVVPKTEDLGICNLGVVVTVEPPLMTIVHPEQDVCVIVQTSVDLEAPWDAEWHLCRRIVAYLRRYAGFNSLLIAYNGGGTTEREVRDWNKIEWPVLLMQGSGRISDVLADELGDRSNVIVSGCNHVELRRALVDAGALGEQYRSAELLDFCQAT